MGLMHVTVTLRVPGTSNGSYEGLFLIDTGATDCMAPASQLAAAGFTPVSRMTYELANGEAVEYPFALARIEFMGEITAGRIIFGPDNIEPILGVTALESVGITIDPTTQTLKRLPAIPLKSIGLALRSPRARRPSTSSPRASECTDVHPPCT